MVKESTRKINQMCAIALLYVFLTLVSSALGLTIDAIQFRLSEALCVLPIFTPVAIPGLVIGCILSNMLMGGVLIDIVCGSLATLLGAMGTYVFRKHRWVAPLFPIISNMLVVPYILQHGYHVEGKYAALMLVTSIAEFFCAYLLGQMLIDILSGNVFDIRRK